MDIKNKIVKYIEEYFEEKGISDETIFLETPKDESLGDFSTTCALKNSKKLNMSPRELAEDISKLLSQKEGIESVSIAGPGFINIKINSNSAIDYINWILENKELKFSKYQNKSANIEYVSANPTGNLHLGHGRNAAYGSALANILRKVGYDVETEYWINDYGNQMDKLSKSIYARYLNLFDIECDLPEGGYISEDVIEVAQQVKDKYGEKFINYESDKLIPELRVIGCEIYLERIRQILKDFNVNIDKYSSETYFYNTGQVDEIISNLEKRELIYTKDGAKWFKSTEFGDDKDRVVIKKDKNYTYMCGDMALHRDKFKRKKDLYVNVWGADHHGYIPRLKGLIEAMGYDSDKLHVPMIQLVQLINDEGQIEKMSKRKGNAITVDELISQIGTDATRYFFLMKPNNTHLNFDLKLATEKNSSNPVYYIQYAQTRIKSVISRANIDNYLSSDLSTLSKSDLSIVSKLMKYENILNSAAKELAPNKLCNYLYDLSSDFHRFYNNSQFITDDENKTKDYIKLISAIRVVIVDGLKVLGLSTPEVM